MRAKHFDCGLHEAHTAVGVDIVKGEPGLVVDVELFEVDGGEVCC